MIRIEYIIPHIGATHIVSSKQGNLNYSFWLTLFVSLTVFSFIMFKIIPIITRWFFEYFKG